MRDLGKKGDGRWHDVTGQRVRFVEHKILRQARDPKSGLLLLGEQVENATTPIPRVEPSRLAIEEDSKVDSSPFVDQNVEQVNRLTPAFEDANLRIQCPNSSSAQFNVVSD